MTPLRRKLHATRSFLMVTFSVAVITLALLVAVARAVLPYANYAAGWVESLVSQTIDQTVSTEYVEGHWRAFGPEFYIDGLSISGPDGQAARFNRASVRVDIYGALLGTRPLLTVTVFGADLQIRRALDGRLHVAGVELKQQIDLSWLIQRGRLELAGSRVTLADASSGLSLTLDQVDLAVADGAALRLQGGLPEPLGKQVSLVYRGDLVRALSGDGRLYVSLTGAREAFFQSLPLPAALPQWRGLVDGEFWVETVDGQPVDVTSRVNFANADDAGQLLATANWRPTLGGWDAMAAVSTVNRRGQRGAASQLQARQSGDDLQVALNRLDLEPLLGFLPTLRATSALPWRPNSTRLGGQISNVGLHWQRDKSGAWALRNGQGRLESLLLGGWSARVPDIEGVEVQFQFARDTLLADVRGDAAVLHYPQVFPQSLLLGELDARLRLTNAGEGGWRLSIDRARTLLSGAEISLQGIVHEASPGGVFADLRYRLQDGDVRWLEDVLPMGIMPAPLTQWLLGAVVQGQVVRADGLLYGPLHAFPFADNDGRFEVQAQLQDVELRFRPEWPSLKRLGAQLSFVNDGFTVTSQQAVSAGMQLTDARAGIRSYSQPWLYVEAQAQGRGDASQRYLRASPLLDNLGDIVGGMALEADTRLALSLRVPLKRALGALDVNGSVSVSDGQLVLPVLPWPIDDIKAEVGFDRQGFGIDAGQARLDGESFTVDLSAGKDRFELEATGSATPSRLLQAWFTDSTLESVLAGSTDVTVGLRRTPAEAFLLEIESTLRGVELALPAPLAKPAEQEMALRVNWPLGDSGDPFSIAAGDLLRLRGSEAPDGSEWRLRFGTTWPKLGGLAGVRLDGRVDLLDADGWLSLMGAISAGPRSRPRLQRVELDVGELRLMRRRFKDLGLVVERDERYWQVGLQSEQLAGELRLPAGDGTADVLLADLQRLHWPFADESLPEVELPTPANGSELPSLQILADDVRLGDYTLGEFRLEAFPDMQGYRIERLETRRAGTDIIASGHWYRGSRSRSVFEARLTATDLGQLLSDFGYANLVRGGQTRLGGVAEWPGAPWDLSLANLQARLDVDIGQGQIVEVEPGAGRVLGLLSLQALPRRLALDFTDFFSEGLSFDSMAGRFEFEDGIARTDELAISALSAEVFISGSTNLLEQTYDQTVIVVPKMSNALPVVGALAGGAAGAAALWVLQDALQAPMGQMARARYSVTGAWQSPQVRLIERVEPASGDASAVPSEQTTTNQGRECASSSIEESECR